MTTNSNIQEQGLQEPVYAGVIIPSQAVTAMTVEPSDNSEAAHPGAPTVTSLPPQGGPADLSLTLPPALPTPPDITHELYNFTLRNGTRQSRFGLTLPATFRTLAVGLSCLDHEPFAPLHLSFDMLYDLGLHAPDFHYGYILERFGMVRQMSMRVILRLLHVRAAFMGFSVATRRGTYEQHGYYGTSTRPFVSTTITDNKGPQQRTYQYKWGSVIVS